MKDKLCTKCGVSHPATKQFFGISDGYLTSPCNPCRNLARRERRKANPEKYRELDRHRQVARDYGLTPDEYESMLSESDNKCQICKCAPSPTKSLAIDHCHSTGNVRGLLCDKCNRGIGMFNDDTDLLQRVIDYLKENT